jgi:hypothetical protein
MTISKKSYCISKEFTQIDNCSIFKPSPGLIISQSCLTIYHGLNVEHHLNFYKTATYNKNDSKIEISNSRVKQHVAIIRFLLNGKIIQDNIDALTSLTPFKNV